LEQCFDCILAKLPGLRWVFAVNHVDQRLVELEEGVKGCELEVVAQGLELCLLLSKRLPYLWLFAFHSRQLCYDRLLGDLKTFKALQEICKQWLDFDVGCLDVVGLTLKHRCTFLEEIILTEEKTLEHMRDEVLILRDKPDDSDQCQDDSHLFPGVLAIVTCLADRCLDAVSIYQDLLSHHLIDLDFFVLKW